jgi:type I restriction enzyme R subunit
MTLTPHTCECPTDHPCDTIHHELDLMPYPERGAPSFRARMAQQEPESVRPEPVEGSLERIRLPRFTDEQRWWLEQMAEHIASNLGLEADDFGYAPFDQRGGLGRVHQLFGEDLSKVIDELNREWVA